MIMSFRHKGLAELWETGATAKVDRKLHARILVRLDTLNVAVEPQELNITGFNFHMLRGFNPLRYTVHVNGPWCVTFEFNGGNAWRVDLEQYH